MASNSELIRKTSELFEILISAATGKINPSDFSDYDKKYRALKDELLLDDKLKTRLPRFLTQCQTLSDFSTFVKGRASTYQQRRSYLGNEFQPANAFLYGNTVTPADNIIAAAISGRQRIDDDWKKALDRRATDPEGAITMARTLLESTFKEVLHVKGFTYAENAKLSELYNMASTALGIDPRSATDAELKRLFGACSSFVLVIGEFRNGQGDAHGRSEIDPKPERRFAELAVNLAGSIASCFISTLEESAAEG